MDRGFVSNTTCSIGRRYRKYNQSPYSDYPLLGHCCCELTFLEIQIKPHTRSGSRNLLPQPLLEFLYIRHQAFVFALHQSKVVSFEQLKLGFESSEVDFLGVVGLVALFACDKTFGEVGDAFVDDVSEGFSENISLFTRDAGCFESLCECLGVEVVRSVEEGGGGKVFQVRRLGARRREGRRG